jgi:RNase H-fold protein (predicted Holliday junction resolvase)
MILVIDPGKEKCGLALFNKEGKVLEQKIVKRKDIFRLIPHYHDAATIVIGDTANGQEIAAELRQHHLKQNIVLFPEKDTTWQARRHYWQAYPPKGWRRFVPTSFLTLPVPVDDYAAVIIGRNYLASAQLRP